MTVKYEPKYWSNIGKFQQEYDNLYKILVPDTGDAETESGQILRYLSKFYYDIYNNGGGNIKDVNVFKEGEGYLLSRCDLFKHSVKRLKVSNFDKKLKAFCKGKAGDRANDQVVDVIVHYVDQRYKEDYGAELLLLSREFLDFLSQYPLEVKDKMGETNFSWKNWESVTAKKKVLQKLQELQDVISEYTYGPVRMNLDLI